MIDSGNVVMLANNNLVEAIAPYAPGGEATLTITGYRDIHVFLYSSGYQTEWNDGEGWAQVCKVTVGDSGVVQRVHSTPNLCVRAQGPVGEAVRVVAS